MRPQCVALHLTSVLPPVPGQDEFLRAVGAEFNMPTKLEADPTHWAGHARIQGMIEDLNMTGHDFKVALFVFHSLHSPRGSEQYRRQANRAEHTAERNHGAVG